MPLPACKPGIPDGNQAGPVAVETACPLPGLKPFKTAPRKTGPPIMPANTGGCKLLIGRMFTAGRANLNGTAARAGVMPGRARGKPRKAPVGARRVVREAGTPSDRSVQPTNGRLYPSPRWGVQPTNGRLYPRRAVTSSSARSSSPSAGLQGADGTRSRCPHPDHPRSGWPFRDPVPDGSFHGHGSGC